MLLVPYCGRCCPPRTPHPAVVCVQVKSRQLKKLFEKYTAKKAEIADLQEQFQREREVRGEGGGLGQPSMRGWGHLPNLLGRLAGWEWV